MKELNKNNESHYNFNEICEKMNNYREPQSKIDREVIKQLYLSGKKQVEIAKYFNTSKSTISEIVKSLDLKVKYKL